MQKMLSSESELLDDMGEVSGFIIQDLTWCSGECPAMISSVLAQQKNLSFSWEMVLNCCFESNNEVSVNLLTLEMKSQGYEASHRLEM